MADDVFLKFEYDERDLVNAMRARLAGRLRGAFVMLAPAGVVAVAAALTLPRWGVYAGAGVVSAALAVAAFAAFRVAPPAIFRADAPGPSPKRPGEIEPEGFRDASVTVDASEDGVAITVGQKLTNVRWDECARLQVDPRCYVLHFGARGFVVVPRRAFRNERRDAAFRELCMSSMELARAAATAEPPTRETEAEPEPEPPVEAKVAPQVVEGIAAPEPAGARPRVGRNDPCPCGSGKKYKRCCLGRDDA